MFELDGVNDMIEVVLMNGETAVEATQIKFQYIMEQASANHLLNQPSFTYTSHHNLYEGEITLSFKIKFNAQAQEYIFKREILALDAQINKT
jgi:hypothetical protein